MVSAIYAMLFGGTTPTQTDVAGTDDAVLRVLSFTSLFPSRTQPRHGIFLEHRLKHLAAMADIDVRVVAPVPWFPATARIFGRYGRLAATPKAATRAGLSVAYPRYFLLPKLGMASSALLMALAMVRPLRRIRRSFEFDVIDAYYLYPDGVAAALLARLFGKPLLLSALGSDVSLIPRYRVPRRLLLWAIAAAESVTVVCRALGDELVRLGVPADKIHVIEHGVDRTMFQPPVDRDEARRQAGFSRPTILSVGHLIDRKGHDLAIKAIARIADVDLVLIGDGPREGFLRQLAARSGVADRVRFLGHVDQAALPRLFGAADLVLSCSDREGIANVLMEAMACGTPVAATPVWGSPEAVASPDAGILLSSRRVEDIVEGIVSILGRQGRRDLTRAYSARFCWTNTAILHKGLLSDAQTGRKRSAGKADRSVSALSR